MKKTSIYSSIFLYMFLLAILFSCNKYKYTKKYIVSKTDKYNFHNSGVIECDSVTMINKNEAILFIDGQKMNLQGELIEIYSNSDFKKE